MHERWSRRQVLQRAGGGLLAATALPTLLSACGDSGSGTQTAAATAAGQTGPTPAAQVTGDLVLWGYPDWYGPDEFADFHKKYPNATVKNVASGSGAAQQIAQLSRGKGKFDLTLAGANVAEQLKQAGALAAFDPATVPNMKLVGPEFVEAFPYGIPTDFGRTGFGYRKDLIEERPTSWAELWELAAKYPGKTTAIKYDSDIQGTALKMLGYSTNTKNPDELREMQDKLLELKPNLRSIIDTDFSKDLVKGNAYFAIDYDYDIALAQQDNENIVWVQPTEGVTAYLEGWVGLADSQHLPAVWALMDFHLEPRNYATFINATGAAYTVPSASEFIDPAIADNPILKYTPENLEGVEFQQFLGPKETLERGKLWEAFLAA